jgi:hypothetical protein
LLTHTMLLEYSRILTPDTLAHSLAIFSVSIWLQIIYGKCRWWSYLNLGIFVFLAYQTRPSYLFLLGFVPVGGWIANWWLFADRKEYVSLGFKLAIVTFIPFVAWCTLRWVLVGHFGLVAFGGYNAIGITGQLLDTEWVDRIAPESRPLANEIIERREKRKDWERKANFATFESQYNPMVWQIAVPAAEKLYGKESRRINYELSHLSREIIHRRPLGYILWLGLAAKHSYSECVEITLLNPTVPLGILAMLVGMAQSWLRRRSTAEPSANPIPLSSSWIEYQTMVWLTFGYAICAMALVILVEVPLSRYCAPAATFLASLPCMMGLDMLVTFKR